MTKSVHCSSPNDTRKSFDVLSAPFPIAEPSGSGAGIKPQFDLRMESASVQNLSLFAEPRSTPSAAAFNTSDALRRPSSFPPVTNRALNDWTEGIAGNFETEDAVSEPDESGTLEGSDDDEVDRSIDSRSRAWDISPDAML